ncbi:MAG TPA: diaminopimelate epimerase [Patescibacteria group bacterium]|nr:diaminopimelate epimerase [Patescibacteria group bacterium]
MEIEVTHMSGAGNLFSIVDNRIHKFNTKKGSQLARWLCEENEFNAFKTEGLILINEGDREHEIIADFFNPDGSHGAMCGNGGRCAVSFALERKFFKSRDIIRFKMAGETYRAQALANSIKVFFPAPFQINPDLIIRYKGIDFQAAYVNVGSDHCVIEMKDLDEVQSVFKHTSKIGEFDLAAFAPDIRNHEIFEPRGANINIYMVNKAGGLYLRTFERGVEAETGACGTGAISAAIIAVLRGQVFAPVEVIPTSQNPLVVDMQFDDDEITGISLEGAAIVLDTVTVTLPEELPLVVR